MPRGLWSRLPSARAHRAPRTATGIVEGFLRDGVHRWRSTLYSAGLAAIPGARSQRSFGRAYGTATRLPTSLSSAATPMGTAGTRPEARDVPTLKCHT